MHDVPHSAFLPQAVSSAGHIRILSSFLGLPSILPKATPIYSYWYSLPLCMFRELHGSPRLSLPQSNQEILTALPHTLDH
jgi:hypothetical protein